MTTTKPHPAVAIFVIAAVSALMWWGILAALGVL